MTRVLVVEPYLTGSHREWALGYQAHSQHEVDVVALPGRFWKWRMHGAAVTLARRVREAGRRPDVVLATDMLDLAAFLGLARDVLGGVPAAVYFHEHQLAYPAPDPEPAWTASRKRRAARHDDAHYPFVNLTSALASDLALWSSVHNRDSFLDRLPAFLRAFPDEREVGAVEAVASRSEVLPLGLDLAGIAGPRASTSAEPAARRPGPPRILWNHRWEHDKGPERFFGALADLAAEGLDFEVIVLGESFVRTPPVFETARRALGERVLCFGHAATRAEYAAWLRDGDIVVSTARHEFFGAAVCEAIACGCWPVLPAALAYPGWIPAPLHASVLYDYDDERALRHQLRRAMRMIEAEAAAWGGGSIAAGASEPAIATGLETVFDVEIAADRPPVSAGAVETFGRQRKALRAAAMAFDWSVMAPRYDARLAELARRPPAGVL